MVKTAKLFKNGQNHAVRLPGEFRVDDDYVFIKKEGKVVILIPAKGSWQSLFNSPDKFSDDFFLAERKQPLTQKREVL